MNESVEMAKEKVTVGRDIPPSVVEDNNPSVEKKAKKSTPKDKSSITKTRLMLSTDEFHPLSSFQAELKLRSIKNFDLNALVVRALKKLPEEYWESELEDITPLEYRVNAALSDPEMRKKLKELLI